MRNHAELEEKVNTSHRENAQQKRNERRCRRGYAKEDRYVKRWVPERRWKKNVQGLLYTVELARWIGVRHLAKWKQQAQPADSRMKRHQGSKKKGSGLYKAHAEALDTQLHDHANRWQYEVEKWCSEDSRGRCTGCHAQRHPKHCKVQEVKLRVETWENTLGTKDLHCVAWKIKQRCTFSAI